MSNDHVIKEFLFVLKKRLIHSFSKVIRFIKRASLPKHIITSENCFEIPIIINNRNRYTFLKLMVDQLHSLGYKNIYILDNDSSYPPLLDYYKMVEANVIFLRQNVGYKALWETDVFKQFKNNYYVYSDPDILLGDNCPKDFVYHLYINLKKYPAKEKAGVALKIDDLPDHYKLKNDVLKWEKVNWEKVLSENVYDSLVDTTLALYKPLAHGNAEECAAIRVGGKLAAQHLPWYTDTQMVSEEELYYKNHAKTTSSYWSSK
ncbi:MAG: glycosyltransferase family 2 protein [Burkholderiales bacterium]|nr:glycosyltransferase family 2 protein [Bacteroidia bacterium]